MFNIIGTKFGNGDKINTFNVPDLRGRFVQGANGNLGTYKEAGLPNITGRFKTKPGNRGTCFGLEGFEGCMYGSEDACGYTDSDGYWASKYANFDASRSSAIYGKSDTVQPPAVCVNYIIKYYC